MKIEGLWPWLCAIGFTALTALTLCVGVYGCFSLATRGEPTLPPPNRLHADLRDQLAAAESQVCREREKVETEARRHEATRAQLVAREQEVLRLAGLLDQLRRHAILFPERPNELAAEDRIPPQNLPVPGQMLPPAIPAAKE